MEHSLPEVLGGWAAGGWAAQGPHTASAAQQLIDVTHALQVHRGQPGLQQAGVGLLVHLVQGLWGRPWGLQVCDVRHVPRAEGCKPRRHDCHLMCVGEVHMAPQLWMLRVWSHAAFCLYGWHIPCAQGWTARCHLCHWRRLGKVHKATLHQRLSMIDNQGQLSHARRQCATSH